MKNWPLMKKLHGRGENTTTLAAKIGSHRCHVSQVLNNVAGRGGQTRRKLARILTAEELRLAGWDGEGNVVGPPEGGTTNGSTGNNVAMKGTYAG